MQSNEWSEEDKLKHLEYLFFWNPDRAKEHWDDHDWKKMLGKINSNNRGFKQELLGEFKVQIGIDIADTHGCQGYSPWENTWRADQLNEGIKTTLTRVFGEENLDKLFTARQLIGAAKKLSDAKAGHEHGAIDNFKPIYEKVVNYRPSNMVEVMLEMDDPVFTEWFKDAGIGKNANETITELNLIITHVNRSLFRQV